MSSGKGVSQTMTEQEANMEGDMQLDTTGNDSRNVAIAKDVRHFVPPRRPHPSQVRTVEPGTHILPLAGGKQICTIDSTSGLVVHDNSLKTLAEPEPPGDNGWITSAQSTLFTPLNTFQTTWQVPPPPANNANQEIYIFNGYQTLGWILQPVLQWGTSPDGSGGGYWNVASWFVAVSGAAFHTPLVAVQPGDTVTGVMTRADEGDNLMEWAPQNKVPNVGTSYGPSLAVFNDSLYMAWKGAGNDNGIWWANGGPSFGGQSKVPGVGTDVGPALAEYDGLLYMAWKGAGGDPGIWWSTTDGVNPWTPQQKVPGVGTSGRPALVVFGGALCMAWKGVGGDQGIYMTSFTTKTEWAGQNKISNVGTSEGPTLAVFNGQVHMAWKGASGDQGIWWSTTSVWDAGHWAGQQKLNGLGTSQVVSLAPFGNMLVLAWKGAGGDQGIWWTTYTASGGWNQNPQQQNINGVGTSVGPSLANVGASLVMAWKGAGNDNAIWWSILGGGITYDCFFENKPTTFMRVTDYLGPDNFVAETLECYNINEQADYPATWVIPMRDISVALPAGNPPFAWQAVNAVTTYGQHTEIVSNNISGQGEVDLWLISQAVVPGVGTNAGPALTEFGRGLYMAWRGAGNDQGIWHATLIGDNWSPQARVPNVGSSDGPALAPFGDTLYMSWKGASNDQGIWWSTLGSGGWAGQQKVAGVGTTNSPTLAALGDTLYMAWKGAGNDQGIWWTTYTASGGWNQNPQQNKVPGVGTSASPSLTVLNGRLYMLWKGASSDQSLWWSSTDGVSPWAPQKAIPGVGSSTGPGLSVFQGKLFAAWKGAGNDNSIWWSEYLGEGNNWAAQQKVPGVGTSNKPALSAMGSRIFMAWKGVGGDQEIWWSGFDGNSNNAWGP